VGERRVAMPIREDRLSLVLGRAASSQAAAGGSPQAWHNDELGGDGGRFGMASTRAGGQSQDIVGIGLAEELSPCAHPQP
jgi:hypothetical protein